MEQSRHNRNHEVIRHKPLTPIEKLLKDKIELREKCRVQEKKLCDDFAYIRDNASSLLLSGVSSLLFSSRNATKRNGKLSGEDEHNAVENMAIESDASGRHAPILVSDLFALSKTLWPVVWEIAQPILITWGVRKASSLFLGLFFKKKKSALRR
jgi:hypothetical protein